MVDRAAERPLGRHVRDAAHERDDRQRGGAWYGSAVSEPAARQLTYAEYRALEEASDAKHEFVDGEARAVSGGTPEHARLQARMTTLLSLALANKPCEPFSSELRVHIAATRRSAYPDVTVICAQVEHADADPRAATNPTVIVEVLSPNTEADDRGEKWAHYQTIPSLRHYVLVSQHRPRLEVYTRTDLGWHYAEALPGSTLTLSAIDAAIPLDELYASRLGG